MGLGLSICHTIVSNHQGRLTATSRPGEGTELTFDLPVGNGIRVSAIPQLDGALV
jgi:signal transduction histidine kinase